MSAVQATALAKATLLAFLQAQIPAVLPAVNSALGALLPAPLVDFASYTDFEPVALPARPALFVLSQGAALLLDGPSYLEAEHSFFVGIVVTADPESATQLVEGYVAAVLSAIAATRDGTASVPNGCTFSYGPKFVTYSPIIQTGTTYNRESYIDVTVRLGEAA